MSSVTPEEAIVDAMQLYDRQGCLHEQFVRQAKAVPEAVAVVTHDGMMVKKWCYFFLYLRNGAVNHVCRQASICPPPHHQII
jgi:ABC-type polysaccharide/polyol phosphate transport system ATPase subunit